MINKKILLTLFGICIVGIVILFSMFSLNKADDVKAQVIPQSESEVKKENKNLALEIAFNDFKNLEEFNIKFFDTPDEAWMIPDVSSEGSNDGGNSHGWSTSPTKDSAEDKNIIDNNTGKVVYTIKASDGATAGEIRKALTERDR